MSILKMVRRFVLQYTSIFLLLFSVLGVSGCASGNYELLMVPVFDEDWGALKYNAKTGEAWRALRGVWIKIRDTEVLPVSNYSVEMVALDKEWGAIRIDNRSGKTWRAKEGKWIFMP